MDALVGAAPGARPAPVDERWREAHGRVGDVAATMRSRAWTTDVLDWCRVAVLEAQGRSTVFSALALPRPHFALPLFGAEVVEISGRVTVVAIDWIPVASPGAAVPDAAAVRARHAGFPAGGRLPPWAEASFSEHALFSRPNAPADAPRLRSALHDYLSAYLRACAAARPDADPSQVLAAQRAYCGEHRDNDPGGGMLRKVFGADWAEGYAREFLYRLGPRP